MKNKATLVLIELAVMLTVFALAAALCLNAFGLMKYPKTARHRSVLFCTHKMQQKS